MQVRPIKGQNALAPIPYALLCVSCTWENVQTRMIRLRSRHSTHSYWNSKRMLAVSYAYMLRMGNSNLKMRIAITIFSRVRYFAHRSALHSWCYLPGRLSITTHVRNKLIKANKCLFTLRSLRNLTPKLKVTIYNLRHISSHRPKMNTDWVKNSYFNRLNFKYDLAL